jgi:hypothetical protein
LGNQVEGLFKILVEDKFHRHLPPAFLKMGFERLKHSRDGESVIIQAGATNKSYRALILGSLNGSRREKQCFPPDGFKGPEYSTRSSLEKKPGKSPTSSAYLVSHLIFYFPPCRS